MKDIKYGLLCFVPMVIMLIFWNSLPEDLPIHFNWFGDADSIAGKCKVAVGVPVLGFLGHICYMLLLDRKPQWIGRKGFHKYSFLYFPILTCSMVLLLLWNR